MLCAKVTDTDVFYVKVVNLLGYCALRLPRQSINDLLSDVIDLYHLHQISILHKAAIEQGYVSRSQSDL